MGPPLSIINEFIYQNLITPLPICQVGHSKEIIYSKEANMPENLSKKTKDINGILNSYEEYIRTVCGNIKSSNPEVNWNAHMRKWENLKPIIQGKENTVFTIKNEMNKRTTDSAIVRNRMYQKIEQTTLRDPHPGALPSDTDLLSLATMDLLIQFAYPSLSGYGKFTISFTMRRSYGEEITFTLGPAIPLTNEDGKHILQQSEV
ncbi:LOW QUALITY PROTEIN: hypothetical protein Cgig2_021619 [Carnegiea gigantea]|uniref:Uncharacterized protein n=1 Tax=Carnegiea gigantea TaxID=171969 RepID=A0A9Q1GND7_9CARY|nr:LOW QUALITY PROTEIN: hypothetical protein Cgig2_021619 [Carnegiea gigantea]